MVKSHREGGKIKHTVIFNLGRLDSIEGNPSFQNLAFRLLEISKAKSVTNLDDISEAEISNWGYMVYIKGSGDSSDWTVSWPRLKARAKPGLIYLKAVF